MEKWIVYILGDGIFTDHSRILFAIIELGNDRAFICLLLSCLGLLQAGQKRRCPRRVICEYRGLVADPGRRRRTINRKSITTGNDRTSVNATARQGRDDPHLM